MNQISDLPGDTFAGLAFNYLVWTANTDALLCSVPWNSDYRDIVHFDSQSAIDLYLQSNAGPHIIFNTMTFARPGVPIKISLPYDQCYAYNYLRVRNNALPVSLGGGKTFYYFITDVQYLAPNTTQLTVQLDVWQSFGRDVTFGNCYVERGHVGIANTNNALDYGRQTMIVPEGMDLGNEYQVTYQYEKTLANSAVPLYANTPNPLAYDILVYSTTNLDGPWGTFAAPVLSTATGSMFENTPGAMSVYWFDDNAAFEMFLAMASGYPWITQGIVSVTAIPSMAAYFDTTGMDTAANGTTLGGITKVNVPPDGTFWYYKIMSGRIPQSVYALSDNTWRQRLMDYINALFPGMYTNLTKFLTYPYSLVEFTSYTGMPLVLKPECIPTDTISVLQSTHLAQPGPRVTFAPYRYNATAGSPPPTDPNGGFGSDGGEYLDMTTGITNFPTYPIVNNSYLGYIASNRNSIAYQHTSADWSQQRALSGASAEASNVDQAIYAGAGQVNNQIAQNQNTRDLSISTTANQAAIGVGQAGISGLSSMASGNVVGGAIQGLGGAAAQALSGMNNMNQLNQQANINNTALSTGWGYSKNQMGNVRDTNLTYAQYAAKGDYGNAIAAINAKVQDAKLIQPTTSGQLGGDAFLLATFQWGITAKVKIVSRNVIQQIGDFWMRYGYAVNRFVNMTSPTMSFQCMSKFTYWKMRETYIISSGVPEGFRQTIRGIFEKGVTLWNNPNDVGQVSIYDNVPNGGITL